MWFVLDLPLNAQRLALFRSHEYISDAVLSCATHFFLKVDMLFTDPGFELYPLVPPNQQQVWPHQWAFGMALGCRLREILFAERSLTPLWRVLRGWTPDPNEGPRPMTRMDVLKLWMRHRFRFRPGMPSDLDRSLKIMRMPMNSFIDTGFERIRRPESFNTPDSAAVSAPPQTRQPTPLLRPDELVMAEAIRRGRDMSTEWLPMMAWGFVDPLHRDIQVRTEAELLKLDKQYSIRRQERKRRKAAAAAAAATAAANAPLPTRTHSATMETTDVESAQNKSSTDKESEETSDSNEVSQETDTPATATTTAGTS